MTFEEHVQRADWLLRESARVFNEKDSRDMVDKAHAHATLALAIATEKASRPRYRVQSHG